MSRQRIIKQIAQNAKGIERNANYVLKYLKEHPCTDCGEVDPIVLEFDHNGDKDKAISFMIRRGYSIQRIDKEIAKCVVRCANCHRRKTAVQFGWFRAI